MKSDIEDKLSVSELVVEVGLSECIDMSEETSISGVSIDIKDSSETSDIKSEVEVLMMRYPKARKICVAGSIVTGLCGGAP